MEAVHVHVTLKVRFVAVFSGIVYQIVAFINWSFVEVAAGQLVISDSEETL